MALSIDYLPISVGREPLFGEEGAHCCFYTSKAALEKIERNGPSSKYEDAKLIAPTLKAPRVVFEGLNRVEYSDALCYTGEHAEVGGREMVFLIFAKREWGLVVFDWEWRLEDSNSPGYPINWTEDFGRQIWPKN
ncbi:MAG: hypothetical protein KKA28_07595 [Planctomycetes bacterium]|nr:hypothetical protein [Planctomycetota bacterium]MCG2685441.1 hypothetical protein [Planctomycetales bacterium]